ncbi:MAG: FAD-dependent oxidoreductase, partial [Candidatus Izemoplasmatales bacterium]
MNQVIVIGGGAAGMMAAITAARNGAQVAILEKNNRIGKKILATGNGRCNYTNRFASVEDYNHPDFVGIGLALFGADESINFFQELGIEPKEEEEGKCYPMSEQASSI